MTDKKIEGAIKGLKRLKKDFDMKGSNAQTIERAIQLLRSFTLSDEEWFNRGDFE